MVQSRDSDVRLISQINIAMCFAYNISNAIGDIEGDVTPTLLQYQSVHWDKDSQLQCELIDCFLYDTNWKLFLIRFEICKCNNFWRNNVKGILNENLNIKLKATWYEEIPDIWFKMTINKIAVCSYKEPVKGNIFIYSKYCFICLSKYYQWSMYNIIYIVLPWS